jgi:hypothetical protein
MYCKLTNQNMQTHSGFQWELGKWYEINKDKRYHKGLCSNNWFHCYNHPLLAVIFNPIQANIKNPRLFTVNVKGKKLSNRNVKFGFPYMKLVKELLVPEITATQRIAFSILCTKQVYEDKQWNEWADNWLSGKNRGAAYAVASATANAAAYATAYAAAYATAPVAAYVAYAAAYATAYAAAYAVAYVAAFATDVNLISLVKKAMEY